jgi:hypothetical protein
MSSEGICNSTLSGSEGVVGERVAKGLRSARMTVVEAFVNHLDRQLVALVRNRDGSKIMW